MADVISIFQKLDEREVKRREAKRQKVKEIDAWIEEVEHRWFEEDKKRYPHEYCL